MTTADMMRRAIVADPFEDTVRLAYADFLDDSGAHPQHARVIRNQIADQGSVVADLRAVAHLLLTESQMNMFFDARGFCAGLYDDPTSANWSRQYLPRPHFALVERGFPAHVRTNQARFLGGRDSFAPMGFELYPIVCVHFLNNRPFTAERGPGYRTLYHWSERFDRDHGFDTDVALELPEAHRPGTWYLTEREARASLSAAFVNAGRVRCGHELLDFERLRQIYFAAYK